MTWVAWRLQRTEMLITLGILALLAALLIPTGINMADAYHHDGLGSCVALKSVSDLRRARSVTSSPASRGCPTSPTGSRSSPA